MADDAPQDPVSSTGHRWPCPRFFVNENRKPCNCGKDNPPPAPVARRLVVEMNDRTRRDLGYVCELEGLNKSTVTNRALQLYRRIRDHQEGGGEILLQRPDGTTDRLVIL